MKCMSDPYSSEAYDPLVHSTPERQPYCRYYEIGGGWGNAINWQRYPDLVVGWQGVSPEVGDILFCKLKSGKRGVWRFKRIERQYDPPDMFFADVEPLGYEGEVAIPKEKRKQVFFLR